MTGLVAPQRPVALIPHDTVSGRALTAVIAILTFLACLCAGVAVQLSTASSAWRDEVAREVTIQVRPRAGADLDAEVQKVVMAASASPAIASVRALTPQEAEKQLEPWLGSGLDLKQLPIPRLVVATLASQEPGLIAALRADLAKSAPDAALDDNAVWIGHLSTLGRTLTLVATFLMGLVIAAIAIAIGFATRAAMAGAREIVDVLHFVGASDRFITRHFQLYFFRVSAEGAAMGGAGAVALFFVASLAASRGSQTPDGVTLGVLIGSVDLPLSGYAAILGVCVALAAMAGVFSRLVAAAHLRVLS